MNNKVRYFMVVLLGIFFLFGVGVYGYLSGGEKQQNYKVSVIVESNSLEHWSVLKQGIESGAKEFNMEINFSMVSPHASILECLDVIQREIKNGAEGLILNLENSNQLVKELDSDMSDSQIVIIESEIPLAEMHSYITPDNYQMGFDLGLALLKKHKEGETIGIVSGNKRRSANVERKEGFIEAVGEKNIKWLLEDNRELNHDEIEKMCDKFPVDYMVGFNNVETEAILDVQKEKNKKGIVFGVGNTDKIVYYLDKGLIDTLAVPNEYVMGYASVHSMFNRLNFIANDEEQEITYLLVNSDSLYEMENQKLMFPMVQ